MLRGKLEPAGGGHGELRNLGDNGAEPAMAQSFFKAGEDGFLVTRLDVDHAVGRQAGLREGRRKEVLAGDAPQYLSACPRGDAAGEKGGSRTVNRAISTPGHFMQGAQR